MDRPWPVLLQQQHIPSFPHFLICTFAHLHICLNLESIYIITTSHYCYFNNNKSVIFVTEFPEIRINTLNGLVLIGLKHEDS